MRFTGTLTRWNDVRGFGFITPTQGGQPVFVHIKEFPPGTGRPQPGQVLSFELSTGAGGRKQAQAVRYPAPSAASMHIGQAPRAGSTSRAFAASNPWTPARAAAIPLFALVYAFCAGLWGFSLPLLGWYLGLSALTFAAYGADKSAAVAGRWRTSEQTLHLLALAGGWPGALLAQQAWRHKTRKPGFQAVFWATVLVNATGFIAWHAGWLHTPRPADLSWLLGRP